MHDGDEHRGAPVGSAPARTLATRCLTSASTGRRPRASGWWGRCRAPCRAPRPARPPRRARISSRRRSLVEGASETHQSGLRCLSPAMRASAASSSSSPSGVVSSTDTLFAGQGSTRSLTPAPPGGPAERGVELGGADELLARRPRGRQARGAPPRSSHSFPDTNVPPWVSLRSCTRWAGRSSRRSSRIRRCGIGRGDLGAGVPVVAGAGLPVPARLRAGVRPAGLAGAGRASRRPGGPGALDLPRGAHPAPVAVGRFGADLDGAGRGRPARRTRRSCWRRPPTTATGWPRSIPACGDTRRSAGSWRRTRRRAAVPGAGWRRTPTRASPRSPRGSRDDRRGRSRPGAGGGAVRARAWRTSWPSGTCPRSSTGCGQRLWGRTLVACRNFPRSRRSPRSCASARSAGRRPASTSSRSRAEDVRPAGRPRSRGLTVTGVAGTASSSTSTRRPAPGRSTWPERAGCTGGTKLPAGAAAAGQGPARAAGASSTTAAGLRPDRGGHAEAARGLRRARPAGRARRRPARARPARRRLHRGALAAILLAGSRTQIKGVLRDQRSSPGSATPTPTRCCTRRRCRRSSRRDADRRRDRSRCTTRSSTTLRDAVERAGGPGGRRAEGREEVRPAGARAGRPAVPGLRRHGPRGVLRRLARSSTAPPARPAASRSPTAGVTTAEVTPRASRVRATYDRRQELTGDKS